MEYERLGAVTARERNVVGLLDACRWLKSLNATHGRALAAAQLFVETWPRALITASVQQSLADGTIRKAATTAASTSNPAWAGALAGAYTQPLIDAMQRETVLMRLGLPKAPANVPIPSESAGPSIAWVGQDSPKPVSQLVLDSATIPPAKAAGILVLTNELMKVANGAETVLANSLVRAGTDFVDDAFLNPARAAVAGVSPGSITSTVPPVATGASVSDTVAAVTAAFFAARPTAIRPTFVASPHGAALIAGAGHEQASIAGGSVNGIPLVVTVGAGPHLVLVDAAAVFFADDGGAIDLSEYASIEMDDAPTGTTVLRSLWQNDETGVRLDRFVSWAAAAGAVQHAVLA